MRLQGRIVIVTGAGSGNGRAIAQGMAREGAHIVIADVNQQGGEATAQEIAALGCQTLVLRADVSQVRDIEAMVQAVVALIVAEREWEPPPPRLAAETVVGVRIGFAEEGLRKRVRQAGGRWNRHHKVCEMRYDQAVTLMLEARIVKEKASNNRYPDWSAKHP